MVDQIDNFRYQTYEIDELVRTIERPNPFLLRTFFPAQVTFETSVIEFDVMEGGKRLAPFVSPLAQGRPVQSRGYSTKQLRPAYIKPKKTIRPSQGFIRLPGEMYGGQLTPRQRIDRLLAEEISEHRDMITNRLEWMAAKALIDAQITISGEDYQSVLVDFGRNTNLVVTLGGGVHWDDSNGDPLADLEAMALSIRKYSYGAVADTVVMDGKAWSLFRAKMVDNRNFSTTRRVGSSSIEIGPRNDIDGEQVGELAGRFQLWVYDGRYEDNDGVSTNYLPDYTALVVARGALQGKQYFGAIEDLQGMLVPSMHFVKTWEENDPSGLTVLSQSAPLVGPKRPNASGRITVKS